jgi:hypothetical protein
MDELLRFLQKYEIWIYIVLGVGSLFYIQRMLVSWNEWRNTLFGLERESAQRKLSAALTILILMALIIVSEFAIVSFVVPGIPQNSVMPTATLDILAVPTPTFPLINSTATPSGVQATVAPLSVGCTPNVIEWAAPKPGETVSAAIELKGTINVPNLGFYKYEYAPAGSDTWTTIAAGNIPLINGYIGTWNTTPLVPGDYQLRLVVADNQNNLFPACVVQIRIVSPS